MKNKGSVSTIKNLKLDLAKALGTNDFIVAFVLKAKIDPELAFKMLHSGSYWPTQLASKPRSLSESIKCDENYSLIIYPNEKDEAKIAIPKKTNFKEKLSDGSLLFSKLRLADYRVSPQCPRNIVEGLLFIDPDYIDKIELTQEDLDAINEQLNSYLKNRKAKTIK